MSCLNRGSHLSFKAEQLEQCLISQKSQESGKVHCFSMREEDGVLVVLEASDILFFVFLTLLPTDFPLNLGIIYWGISAI